MVNTQDVLELLLSNGVHCELAELVRYRGIASKLNLAPSGSIKSSMAGTLSSRFKGRGMEFDEARHYQPGDDIRSIDWRVTARTGKTHTKLYREERERPVLVYVDLSSSMQFGTSLLYKSVQALHAAALITFSALSRGDKIGCMAISNTADIERKPKSTAKHALSMLNQLMTLQNSAVNEAYSQSKRPHTQQTFASEPQTPLFSQTPLAQQVVLGTQPAIADTNAHYMNQLAMLAKPGTLVYIISDFSNFSKPAFSVLGKISRHCEIRPLRIFDPIEEALPIVHGMQDVLMSNGQQEQHIMLGDKHLSEQYKTVRMNVFNNLKDELSGLGLVLRQISAARPVEQQLIASKSGLVLGEFV